MESKYVGSEKDLQSLLLRKHSKEGDVAICEDTRKVFQFINGEWEPMKLSGGLEMSLYEMNKQIISQLPPYDDRDLLKLRKRINKFANKTYNNYFMFLCKDFNYYTIFAHSEVDSGEFETVGHALITIIKEMEATVFSADNLENRFEIWIRPKGEEELYDFLFFPYDEGVIEFND